MRFGIEKATKVQNENIELTFRELETLTSTGLTGLLTFLGSGVASHQAVLLEGRSQSCVHLFEGACDTEADCARLTDGAAALDAYVGVNCVLQARANEGTRGDHMELVGVAVVGDGLFVDKNLACAFSETYPRDGGLAATDGDKNFAVAHILIRS